METLIALLWLAFALALFGALAYLVARLTAGTVGPQRYKDGFESAKALMEPEGKRLGKLCQQLWVSNQELWVRNRELENRLQIANRQVAALPPNTVTVPEGHIVTVRPLPKEKPHA